MLNIIRLNDSTDHGGRVIECIANTNLNGKTMAGKGPRKKNKATYLDCAERHLSK